jgi:arsenate reductase-like glutaredoxin family protein
MISRANARLFYLSLLDRSKRNIKLSVRKNYFEGGLMNIQIFGTKKDNDTKKALRFFKERGVNPHFRDLREKGLAKGELENIARKIPLEELIDTEGKQFQKRGMAYMKFDIEEELLEDPLLLKMPIVRFGKEVTLGYEPQIWKTWFEK